MLTPLDTSTFCTPVSLQVILPFWLKGSQCVSVLAPEPLNIADWCIGSFILETSEHVVVLGRWGAAAGGCYRKSLDCDSTSKKRPLAHISQIQLWLLMFSPSKLFKQNHVSVCSALLAHAVAFPSVVYWSMNFKKVSEDEGDTISHSLFSFSLANWWGKRFHWLLTSMTTQPITWQHISTVRPCDRARVKLSIRIPKEEDLRDFKRGESLSIFQTAANLLGFLRWQEHYWSFLVDFRQFYQIHCSFHCFTSNGRRSSLCFVWGCSNPLGVLKTFALQ